MIRQPPRGRAVLVLLLAAAFLIEPASAEQPPAEAPSEPLTFSVQASGVETEDDLDRRLRRADYLFRSICTHCARADRFRSNAPFHPVETLNRKGRSGPN